MSNKTTISIRKLYKCDQCKEIYKNKKSYQKHMLEEHDECETFKCLHCDKTFKQNGNMHIHMMRHHNVNKPPTRIDRNNTRMKFVNKHTFFTTIEHTEIHKPRRFSVHTIENTRETLDGFSTLFSKRNAHNIVDNLNIIYGMSQNIKSEDFIYHWKTLDDAVLSLQNDRPNQKEYITNAYNFVKNLLKK